jgi:hypothetical protein
MSSTKDTNKILVRSSKNNDIKLDDISSEGYVEAAVQNILSTFIRSERLKIASDAYSVVLGVIQAMEDLASKEGTSSVYKLKIVMKVVERISKDTTGIISEDLVRELNLLVSSKLIEGFIESIISVSKGMFKINHKARSTRCFCM